MSITTVSFKACSGAPRFTGSLILELAVGTAVVIVDIGVLIWPSYYIFIQIIMNDAGWPNNRYVC